MRLAALAQHRTTDGLIVSGRALFRGYSCVETSGSAAGGFNLYDAAATGDTAKLIGAGTVAQGVALPPIMFSEGVACERGIVVDIVAATTVVIYYTPITRIDESLGVDEYDTLDVDRFQVLKLARLLGVAT